MPFSNPLSPYYADLFLFLRKLYKTIASDLGLFQQGYTDVGFADDLAFTAICLYHRLPNMANIAESFQQTSSTISAFRVSV